MTFIIFCLLILYCICPESYCLFYFFRFQQDYTETSASLLSKKINNMKLCIWRRQETAEYENLLVFWLLPKLIFLPSYRCKIETDGQDLDWYLVWWVKERHLPTEIRNRLFDKNEGFQWRNRRPETLILQLAWNDRQVVESLNCKSIIAQAFLSSRYLLQRHLAWATL